MRKLIQLTIVFSGLIGGQMVWTSASAETVEVALVAPLNTNHNHYCIDTSGAQERANPEEGLQAYTCYSYRGIFGYDQKMDSEAVAKGQFLMTGFNVCMQAREAVAGSALWGGECDGNELQAFKLLDDKTIRLDSAQDLCVSVGDETREGRGGPGGHQYKDLSLEVCSDDRSAYQQWFLRNEVMEVESGEVEQRQGERPAG